MSICLDFNDNKKLKRSQPWRGALAFYLTVGFMIVGLILTYHFWR